MPERLMMAQIDYAATHIELTGLVLRVLVAANSKPGAKLPEQVQLPRLLQGVLQGRPQDQPEPKPVTAVSAREAFAMIMES